MSELLCRSISKSFGGTRALVQVTCSFAPAKVTAVIGPNGAGKTTLLNVVSGMLRPDSGTVFLDGLSIGGKPPHQIAVAGIGRTFQDLRLPLQMTVMDSVLAAATVAKDDTLLRAILGLPAARRVHIERVARQALAFIGLESYAGSAAGSLSYGQQKLLSIALCIAGGRQTLLLDEPFAGVHPDLIDRIVERLRTLADQGGTIVLVEHDLSAVRQVAHRTVALAHGKVIADGATADVLGSLSVQEAFLAG
jgi:branched-chain amino acid transport system ATP-binding protein